MLELYHNIAGSSVDVQVKNDGLLKTALRIDSSLRIGINNVAPDEALDVTGNIQSSGFVKVNNTTQSETFGTGSIITLGGLGVAKNINVGENVGINGTLTTTQIIPDENNTRNIGSADVKYANMYSTTFVGNLTGNVNGTVSGRAGSADKLTSASTLRITGDVSASDVIFDGQTGGSTKTFTTTISNEIIAGKENVSSSQSDDELLVNRTSGDTGLKKISRVNFLAAVPRTPVGLIAPYAGLSAPSGWLLCDGSEVDIAQYGALHEVIGKTYKASPEAGKFAVPDLRGRVPMGADNMGGESADVVTEAAGDVLGSKSGAETVTVQVENLPEHEHDLRGDSGDQYYAIRDVSGTPTDTDAVIYDAPTGSGAGQAYPNSGGILTEDTLGTPMNNLAPYMTINYIIYTGQ